MNICIFTHTFPRFSGDTAAPFMGELVNALAKKGHKIFVLTPFDEKIKKQRRNYKLITYKYIFPKKLHILGYSKTLKGDKTMSMLSYLISPFLYVFGFVSLLKLVKQQKIDIVSSHWIIPNGFMAALVSKITKVPFTATIPGSDVYMGGKNFLFRWMVGFAARNANYTISDSPYYLKQLNDLGYYPDKTEIIRYGVNIGMFRPEKKDKKVLVSLKIKSGSSVILAVGRMVAKKGFIYIIKAIPQVIKKIPDVRLVMIGNGEERKKLELLAEKLKIQSKVIFTGAISYNKLPKYFNLADVFVMPSIKDEKGNIDASPVTMMEAMACGVPVVATKFSGNKDLVIENKTGSMVREKDHVAIANSIIKLLSFKRKREMKRKVRKIAVENFSSGSVAKRYLDCFKKIAK